MSSSFSSLPPRWFLTISFSFYSGVYLPSKERVRSEAGLQEDDRFGSLMHEMSSEDTEGGEFSFIEYNSGSGLLSTSIAERYPRATVISIEPEESHVQAHLSRLRRLAQSKVNIAGSRGSQSSNVGGGVRGKKIDEKKKKTKKENDEDLKRLADVGANNWVCQTTPNADMLTKL